MSLILSGSDGVSDIDGTVSTPAIRGTDSNTGIFFPAADTIAFTEGGTESMRISSGGEVGIGSTATTYKLNIQNASASAFDGMQVAGDNSSYNLVFQSGGVSASGTLFGVNKARGQFISSNNSPIVIGTLDVFPLVFGTNATERMRITSTGTVLLGTTSTSSFDEGFRANPTGSGNSMQVIISNTGGGLPFLLNRSDDGNIIDFRRAGSNVGTVSITTSSTSYNTSSDYRLKENIAPMTGALATVAQLKPVTYKWKSDGSDGQGFIAHELQAVVPDCVSGAKDAVDEEGNPVHQGIDTSFLVATLTAAIQELKAELDSVKAELQTLKGN